MWDAGLLVRYFDTFSGLGNNDFTSKSNYISMYDKQTLASTFFIYDVWTPSSLIKNTMEISLINSRWVLFKPISAFGGSGISDEIVFGRMLLGFTDSKSTMVQIMAWCLHATSLYMSQCWWSSVSPYGVISPQWIKRDPYMGLLPDR